MEAKITKDYINKNTQWLGNGDYITMGVMDMSSDWTDCRGTRDAVMGIRSFRADLTNQNPVLRF